MKSLILFAFKEGVQISIKQPSFTSGLVKVSIGHNLKKVAIEEHYDPETLAQVDRLVEEAIVEKLQEKYLRAAYPERYDNNPGTLGDTNAPATSKETSTP